jgi:hypothetical protein
MLFNPFLPHQEHPAYLGRRAGGSFTLPLEPQMIYPLILDERIALDGGAA